MGAGVTTQAINITHGGDLDQAVREFGLPREKWLDLSTGIAPWNWPIPDIPTAIWQRLPAVDCPLRQAAEGYYGCDADAVLAIPGSQFAIQTLPQLFPNGTRVAIPELGYFEHRKAWQKAGHQLADYSDQALDQLELQIEAGELDVVLVINPNNPTAALLERTRLLYWCELLARRGGCLIVDEAFMDTDQQMSLAPECPRPGLVVLRSLGKFFGLAGLRLGFALAEPLVLELLSQRLGPWAVNGPAQYLGRQALLDKAWQQQQKQRIAQAMIEQVTLLESVEWGEDSVQVAQGPLFCSVKLSSEAIEKWRRRCGQQGILVRRFAQSEGDGLLRFGLTKNSEQLQRLAEALLVSTVQGSLSDE